VARRKLAFAAENLEVTFILNLFPKHLMTQIIMHIPHRQQYARTHSLSAALNIILNWKLENVLLHQKIFPNLKFFSFFKKKIKEVLIKLAFGTKIDLSSC